MDQLITERDVMRRRKTERRRRLQELQYEPDPTAQLQQIRADTHAMEQPPPREQEPSPPHNE